MFEWEGQDSLVKGRLIPYLKACKMISNGCIYHMVRFWDVLYEVPSLESIPIVNEFPNVLLKIFTLFLPKGKMIFRIDLLPYTEPISMPPYRMALMEQIDHKDPLKDLLE